VGPSGESPGLDPLTAGSGRAPPSDISGIPVVRPIFNLPRVFFSPFFIAGPVPRADGYLVAARIDSFDEAKK
jgi:hypothetical protein